MCETESCPSRGTPADGYQLKVPEIMKDAHSMAALRHSCLRDRIPQLLSLLSYAPSLGGNLTLP